MSKSRDVLDEGSAMTRQPEFGYVIIVNHTGPIPLRHIVELCDEYQPLEFRSWYYEQYHELEGDRFCFCKTKDERDDLLMSLGYEL